MKRFVTVFARLCVFLIVWQVFVFITEMPHYLLPKPTDILHKIWLEKRLLLTHAQVTLQEIFYGLVLGLTLGITSALLMSFSKRLSAFLLPILIVMQAIPLFAIAPLLVLWLGYGMTSKVAMTVLMIYFPITAACFDGLRQTPRAWLELAHSYQLPKWRILLNIRLPAALPSLASGLRIAVSVAPIGAVVGEWVGSSRGLGYLLLHANARMQIDVMFAALCVLLSITLSLYFVTDFLLKRFLPWVHHR